MLVSVEIDSAFL